MLSDISFSRKVFIYILGVTLLATTMTMIPVIWNITQEYKDSAALHSKAQAQVLADMSSASILFDQPESASKLLGSLRESPNIQSAALFKLDELSGDVSLFAYYGGQGKTPVFSLAKVENIKTTFGDDFLETITPVKLQDSTIGYLLLHVGMDEMTVRVKNALSYLFLAIACASVVAAYLTHLARKSLVQPISELSSVTKAIADTKDYSQRANKTSDDELGSLVDSFNSMIDVIEIYDRERRDKEKEILNLNKDLERNVEERTSELRVSLKQLSATVNDLKLTQNKLVEQEKMASLGSLVAGVAHEINTPIGVAITAASHLSQTIRDISGSFVAGKLTKGEFKSSMDDVVETTNMVLKNLERAAEQVKSFKMVAVDQSNEEIREFNFKEYVENIVISLRPKLKRTQHTINLEMPEDINMNSYPGAYSQIFTNLIMNSLIHGFEGIDKGIINIRAKVEDGYFYVDYFDNGKGIPEEIKGRIFDPFVTTNRHEGGSGLGTHILYNLVTQVLKGSISVADDVVRGVHFAMVIPVTREKTKAA